MSKSVLIIGLGRFGHHLCEEMVALGNEVLIIDRDEEAVKDLMDIVTNAKVGDCTKKEVLASLGVGNFDLIFVCIGTNFQSSLEVTYLVKILGGKMVIFKATRDVQAEFLLRNGADKVVYPDKDSAVRIAMKYSTNHIYDYMELSKGYSIFELEPPASWIGKSIREENIRAKYHVSVFGVKNGEELTPMPDASYIINKEDHLMVVGKTSDLRKIIR